MKKMRKLIPAFCMLLLSAVMLSTSTFAWFSMNTKVSATSMTVQAKASKNLLISTTADSGYAPTLSVASSLSGMVPASTSGTGIPTFYKLKDVGHGMSADSYAKAFDTTFEAAVAGTDYYTTTMYLKTTGQSASNLKANITHTAGGIKDLDPALRVMIVINDTTRFYYTPVATSAWKGVASISDAEAPTACTPGVGADASLKAIAGITYYEDNACANATTPAPAVGADVTGKYFKLPAGVATLAGSDETVSTSASVILASMAADTAVKVDVYIWYEGEDVHCKSTYAVDLDATTFDIEFTVE